MDANTVHLLWMQTVSFSASTTPPESSLSNLLCIISSNCPSMMLEPPTALSTKIENSLLLFSGKSQS